LLPSWMDQFNKFINAMAFHYVFLPDA